VNTARSIVKITVLAEGALFFLALPWFLSVRSSYVILFDLTALTYGLVTAAFLLLLSYLLDTQKFSALEDFRDNVVLPLCRNLTIQDAIIIALASGVAEELLFRGLIQEELNALFGFGVSLVLTNLIFAYVHIIGSVKRYLPLLFVYLGAGAVFSLVTELTQNLLPAMIAHALFNFTSILWMKRKLRQSI